MSDVSDEVHESGVPAVYDALTAPVYLLTHVCI